MSEIPELPGSELDEFRTQLDYTMFKLKRDKVKALDTDSFIKGALKGPRSAKPSRLLRPVL